MYPHFFCRIELSSPLALWRCQKPFPAAALTPRRLTTRNGSIKASFPLTLPLSHSHSVNAANSLSADCGRRRKGERLYQFGTRCRKRSARCGTWVASHAPTTLPFEMDGLPISKCKKAKEKQGHSSSVKGSYRVVLLTVQETKSH